MTIKMAAFNVHRRASTSTKNKAVRLFEFEAGPQQFFKHLFLPKLGLFFPARPRSSPNLADARNAQVCKAPSPGRYNKLVHVLDFLIVPVQHG